MADFDLLRTLAQPAQTKIVLLVMDGLGGLPRAEDDRTELEAAHLSLIHISEPTRH